ncbi:cytochrome P450 [Chaetomium sp. MPI-CAGE-AT-0009]|nr:cytochrome P450 [Chaetomium sp. MPI-CAGE-AT-0009]
MGLRVSLSANPIARPSPALILYILGFFLLVHSVRRVRAWYRLRHIPGPPLAGWTSLWLTKRYLDETFFLDVPALVDQYGPLVRIGPDKVVCTDVDAVYGMSGVRSDYRKSDWYTIARISRGGDHIFTLIDPEERKERKNFIMPAYAGRGVDHFEKGTDRALAAFIDLIDKIYLSTPEKIRPMNLEDKIHYYALDAIGEIAYSESFKYLEEDRDVKGILAVNDATVPLLMALGNYVSFWKMLRTWPFYYLLPNDGDESGFGAIAGHISYIVKKRLRPDAGPKHDMLQSFIDHGLRGDALKQEVGIQFFAGSDTVSSLLYTTFYLLLTHPAVYTRLQAELDAAYTTTTTTGTQPTTIIRDAQARALPYLQSVIREGLRLFPPLCAPPIYKEVPRGGDVVCGRALPAGTWVATGNQMWHGNREKGFWGRMPTCFGRSGGWRLGFAPGLGGPWMGMGGRRAQGEAGWRR